jgi:hypothetical protein
VGYLRTRPPEHALLATYTTDSTVDDGHRPRRGNGEHYRPPAASIGARTPRLGIGQGLAWVKPCSYRAHGLRTRLVGLAGGRCTPSWNAVFGSADQPPQPEMNASSTVYRCARMIRGSAPE